MADLQLLFEALSFVAVGVPIVAILLLLTTGGYTVVDLFMVRDHHELAPRPAEEDPSPRWRPELIRPRVPSTEPREAGASSLSLGATGVGPLDTGRSRRSSARHVSPHLLGGAAVVHAAPMSAAVLALIDEHE